MAVPRSGEPVSLLVAQTPGLEGVGADLRCEPISHNVMQNLHTFMQCHTSI